MHFWSRLWCSAALYKVAWAIAVGMLLGGLFGAIAAGCAKATHTPVFENANCDVKEPELPPLYHVETWCESDGTKSLGGPIDP